MVCIFVFTQQFHSHSASAISSPRTACLWPGLGTMPYAVCILYWLFLRRRLALSDLRLERCAPCGDIFDVARRVDTLRHAIFPLAALHMKKRQSAKTVPSRSQVDPVFLNK